jgi:hypothetical protein
MRRRGQLGLAGLAVAVMLMLLAGCAPCSILPIPGASPEIQFWAGQDMVEPGGCTLLHWQVSSGEQYPVFLDGRAVAAEGQEDVCLEQTETFELVVGAPSGSIREIVTVQVGSEGQEPPPEEAPPEEPPPQEPGPEGGPEVVVLVVAPDVVAPGGCAMLHWEVVPPEWPVLINGEEVTPVGEREECPSATTAYELTVDAPGGVGGKSVTLRVEGSGPGPEPTPPPPAQPTATTPPPAQPTTTTPPPAQPTATTPPAATGADVWPSDLYPDNQPQGNIWVRVFNNGPAAVTNKKVRISGSQTRSTKTSPPSASGYNIAATEYTINLAPGQQQNLNLGWQVDLSQYNYDFTVTVEAVGFTDPNLGNNTYEESFQYTAPTPTQATLVLKNNGANNVCYVHYVLSPAGANSHWGVDKLGSNCILPGGTHQWQVSAGTYDLIAYDGTHAAVLGQKLGVNITGTYNWNVP